MAKGKKNFHGRLLCGAAAIALLSWTSAQAQDARFDIAPQPLDTALREFGVQSGVTIMADAHDTLSKQSPGFSATADPETALKQLLAGTGLSYRRSGDVFVVSDASDPQSGSAAGDGAEGTVQALIVTAQKREENIQDVPIAMSAFTQEDLTRSQVAGGPDLMTQVPNFTFTKTNFSGYSIQIRGIGTQAISATTDPAVAVAFNNTPFIRNRFFEQEFYDLERVEVLRGPQGTLYGRNATAGVVNIISGKPKYEFEARLSGDVSNYNSSRLEGMVNIPLIEDKAALRIAGAWTKRDGYVKNILTGQQTDGRDLWSSRVSLRLDPSDKLNINLIWEHFSENDDRLRSGKQLCHTDPGPSEVNGQPVSQTGNPIGGLTASYVSQGCLPASLYSPDSFQTPNGYALGYYGPLGLIGLPVYMSYNPYVSTVQSRNLRDIETHLKPDYEASTDTGELQWKLELPYHLTFASETGFLRDRVFSFEDYNRFDTRPGVFTPGGADHVFSPQDLQGPGSRLDITDLNGVFCDPQLGCTNRLAAGDLSTARSRQFSQEFRLSSDWMGPFNFSMGTNFLRYDTEDKYYVFINTLTMWEALSSNPWIPGVSDNSACLTPNAFYGSPVPDPLAAYRINCAYIDPNNVHNLNDQGRNYFLSRNPYHLLSYAAFGEAYYNVTSELKLTAGFRWTVDKKTAPEIPSWLLAGGYNAYNPTAPYGTPTYKVHNLEWREPTGRIALDWKPKLSFTNDTLIYGSYVRGYKAGGANPPPPVFVGATVCPPDCPGVINGALATHYLTHPETFKPEFVNAYEIGTKNTLLDGRLTANLAAFYYDYKGYQISEIVDRAAINFNYDATVKGLELELDWRPLENFRLGFKGGYEDTRVANGQSAVDLMDRTAGKPGWMVFRPFPTLPSSCVIPTWLATIVGPQAICSAYFINVDPVTYLPYVPNPTVTPLTGGVPAGYPGYDPASANNGQGFTKDLSGHELPNAPKFTTTITVDYTVPLPNDWLATLHADLYRQSEAWTRIFNDPGYDKLKAYTNVNVAAIFSNEDRGWQVMAYVKNVFNKDNITGAFLNSDDTGLTTNVFLNEPRLFGIRVTKNWTGGSTVPWLTAAGKGPAPLTVELGAQGQRVDAPIQPLVIGADAFPKALDPRRPQMSDLDWTHSPEVRFTYQPSGSPWRLAAGVRYARTTDGTGRQRLQEVAGPRACEGPLTGKYAPIGKTLCDPNYILHIFGQNINLYGPQNFRTPIDRLSDSVDRKEEHVIADFDVGKDVGLGMLGEGRSWLSAGIRYAQFTSNLKGDMRGVPDVQIPDGWGFYNKYPSSFHQYAMSFESQRKFKGAGPTLSWEASRKLFGSEEAGQVNLDWALTGGVLFGKQATSVKGAEGSSYFHGQYPFQGNFQYPNYPNPWIMFDLQPPAETPFEFHRTESATVPIVDLNLGLSYGVPGVKIGAGYRWERYFNVIDAGFQEHKSFDRTIDGPYVKFSLGFGG